MSTLPRITTFQIIFEGILLLPGIICQPNNLKLTYQNKEHGSSLLAQMSELYCWDYLNDNKLNMGFRNTINI